MKILCLCLLFYTRESLENIKKNIIDFLLFYTRESLKNIKKNTIDCKYEKNVFTENIFFVFNCI